MESPESPDMASTAQALLASAEVSIPLSDDVRFQGEPAMASAGDITLVVWTQNPQAGQSSTIRGMRVRKSDGALLDATPLCIACDIGTQYEPRVASNGTDFLVTWTHLSGGPPSIRGVRVRGSDGAVLGPSALLSV
jgi:hypothetical protein